MDSKILIDRICDTADICEKNNTFKFLGFLAEEECVLAERVLEKRNIRFEMFGGYFDAKRKVLACLPEWAKDVDYPITALSFSFRKEDNLSHRDFLGSLMSLGLKRETVGDILVEKGNAVVFVLSEIAEYVISEITKIGRTGVKITKGYEGDLPMVSTLCEFSDTIASERLDCVVASLAGVSRNTANEKIDLGLVSVNSQVVLKNTKAIIGGDVISIRGKGKFIIDSVCEKTRKNRIILKYKKYV